MDNNFDRDAILNKIRAMAELADPERGGTQGEIENAARMMQRMMDQYNISMLEVMNKRKEDPKLFTTQAAEYKVGIMRAWHWSLARAVDRIVGTRHFSHGGFGVNSRREQQKDKRHSALKVMNFFGSPENIKLACQLYDTWCVRIDAMATAAVQEYNVELEEEFAVEMMLQNVKQVRFLRGLNSRHPQIWRTSWLDGCTNGIHSALYEEEKQREKEQAIVQPVLDEGDAPAAPATDKPVTVSYAISLYKEKVDLAYKHYSKGFRTVNTSSRGTGNWSAFDKGHQVGKGIRLNSKELKG